MDIKIKLRIYYAILIVGIFGILAFSRFLYVIMVWLFNLISLIGNPIVYLLNSISPQQISPIPLIDVELQDTIAIIGVKISAFLLLFTLWVRKFYKKIKSLKSEIDKKDIAISLMKKFIKKLKG